jgi:CheY-like chemotaxis protein
VLLVEDSATVRLLESMLLQEAGFEVDAVADGHEALARATAQPYQLLVTAVETRGLRGLDLAAAVRGSPGGASLPIVLMSSDDNAEHRRQAAELGVDAYIRKGSLGQRRLVDAARELAPRA